MSHYIDSILYRGKDKRAPSGECELERHTTHEKIDRQTEKEEEQSSTTGR